MYSEIVIILDRSGSMQDVKSDHEGGLRKFVEDQKSCGGDAKFTLVQFDGHNPFDVVYDGIDIQKVEQLDLNPRGTTPLVEAVFRTITHVKERLDKQSEQPSQVVFMIITDGYENASNAEYTKARLKDLIKSCESKSWVFMYLGANVDEFSECQSMGMNVCNSAGFVNNSGSLERMYCNLSSKTIKARSALRSSQCDISSYYNFSDEERSDMKE